MCRTVMDNRQEHDLKGTSVMHENKKIEERVILVGVSEQDGDDTEDSLAELAELVRTAGAAAVGTVIQKLERRFYMLEQKFSFRS